MAEGLCRFKPNRLPLGYYEVHNDARYVRRAFVVVHFGQTQRTYFADVLNNHGFSEKYYPLANIDFAKLPYRSPSHYLLDVTAPDLENSFIQCKSVSVIACPNEQSDFSECKKFTPQPIKCQ
ncbi:hypothetical protein PMAYCL1PPCAC_26238 [Pristionchus mayeri]|uniref:Uncharacterized protein n=1 Tax=Pristionchus mayeri TaxID=1317129 RepID=A0AAN5D3M9_9BILA|nr:hypothetical protein PMAYCL1PPCAC_26238 [Pristionchus mayeri]